MKGNDDRLVRAYSTLTAMKNQLEAERDPLAGVRLSMIAQYHRALDLISGVGYDTAEFRIPDADLYVSGHERWCHRTEFLSRLEGVVTWFSITHSEPPPQIGFTPRQ